MLCDPKYLMGSRLYECNQDAHHRCCNLMFTQRDNGNVEHVPKLELEISLRRSYTSRSERSLYTEIDHFDDHMACINENKSFESQ